MVAYRQTIAPRFANPQQAEFFWSEASEILYSGAFGAGKSRILCEKALDLAQSYPGAPLALVRKVKASIAATTKMTFLRDVLLPSHQPFRQNKTEDWVELPNGSRITFFGLDADPDTGVPSKVGSFDGAWIGVDEAVELDEGDWVMLEGRLRSQAVPFRQLAAATNPGDPLHWLIRRFQEPTPRRRLWHASTFDNAFLPADYLDRMAALTGIYRSRYAEGLWVAVEGALWSPDDFRYFAPPQHVVNGSLVSDFHRVVVGVDPAVTSNKDSDETGIIVAGAGADGKTYILDDQSCRLEPNGWAKRAVAAYDEHQADLIVAEANNGGEMVAEVIRTVRPSINVKLVHASRGKRTRAEPISSLYHEDKVRHVRRFPELESQMCAFDPTSNVSPDRMDALVWAVHELGISAPTISGPFMVNV